MKLLNSILILLSLFYSFNAFAQNGIQEDSTLEIHSNQNFTPITPACNSELMLLSDADSTNITIARQGCCSHHGGVCGCSNGRTVCCDSTFSPSCGC